MHGSRIQHKLRRSQLHRSQHFCQVLPSPPLPSSSGLGFLMVHFPNTSRYDCTQALPTILPAHSDINKAGSLRRTITAMKAKSGVMEERPNTRRASHTTKTQMHFSLRGEREMNTGGKRSKVVILVVAKVVLMGGRLSRRKRWPIRRC